MKKNILIIFLFLSANCFAQLNIVPMPAEVKMGKGNFELTNKTSIFSPQNPEHWNAVENLNSLIKRKLGFKLSHGEMLSRYPTKNKNTSIHIDVTDDTSENYKIEISQYQINFSGSVKGLFYAFITFEQLLPSVNRKPQTTNHKLNIPQLTINDYPRFPYRGMHLDVGRHFFPVSFIKKYIDYLAAYKYNIFHWHLTEDQGWRIEIKKYPDLTTIGGWRNGTIVGRYPGKGSDNRPYGGFYTQAEIKEVVQYAKERYIDVIPEIEMPGHSSAAIAAYPWLSCFPQKPTEIPAKMISQKSIDEQKAGRIKLVQETWGVFDDVFCAGKDSTFKFLENVIDEVITLFPSKYFHLGADECPKAHWKLCSACQKRMKDNNLKDEHELQSWFVQRIEKYLNSKGKTLIGWDEILEGGLAPNAVVMSWRGEAGGIEAAKQKHQVIMTPGNPVYFDHTQSKNEDSVTIGGYNPIENVYAYEPIPKELNAEQGKYILGAQANMWTEYMQNTRKIEYMMFPRMVALSEVLWSPKEKRNWKDFERRLPTIFGRLEKQKINYSKAYYDLKATVLPTENYDGVLWKLESKTKNGITINFNNADSIWGYENPQLISRYIFLANAISKGTSISQKFYFNKATGKKITLTSEADKKYPGDGAFTLVNGVQNEKGMAKTSEFLGFNGTDMEAIIDLGSEMNISKVTLHVLDQSGSWIYLPAQIEVTYIPNVDYTEEELKNFPKQIKMIDPEKDKGTQTISIESKQNCRYVKVVAKNYGIIPMGNPGAGNRAWLFVDEIEAQ